MVIIRMARWGAKRRPFYRVVVTENSSKRDGRYIERLGFYNPVAKGQEVPFRIDTARVEYWLNQGAQISNSVKNLVKKQRAQLVNGPAQAEGAGESGDQPVSGEEAAQPSV